MPHERPRIYGIATSRRKAMSLADQVLEARAHVRKLKRVSPHIFNEWQRLQNAKRSLEEARREHAAAAKAWKEYAA